MQKEKQCGNCREYNAFYTKAYCSFLREDYGYCYKQHKVMRKGGICDCWRVRVGRRRSVKNTQVLQALEKGLTDIAILRQIFSEQDE